MNALQDAFKHVACATYHRDAAKINQEHRHFPQQKKKPSETFSANSNKIKIKLERYGRRFKGGKGKEEVFKQEK